MGSVPLCEHEDLSPGLQYSEKSEHSGLCVCHPSAGMGKEERVGGGGEQAGPGSLIGSPYS